MSPAQAFDAAQPLIHRLALVAIVVVLLTGCGP